MNLPSHGKSEKISPVKTGRKTNTLQIPAESPVQSTSTRHDTTDPEFTQQSSHTQSTDLSTGDDVRELDRVVEQFRDGNISKSRAIASITTRLNFDLSGEEPEKFAALDQYLSAIESYERLTVGAAERGAHATGHTIEGGNRGESRTGQPEGAGTIDQDQFVQRDSRGEASAFLDSLAVKESPKCRRRRRHSSVSTSSSSDTTNESDNERGLSSKKKRIYEKDMPWYNQEIAARQSGNTSSEESRRILLLIGDNVSAIKRWVAVAKTAPRGFPMSEWENIAKGKSVNLDVVLSSLHHIAPVKENIGRVGPTEISLGRSEPVRRVHTSGEWTSAWNATVKATSFIFPHRATELREYGDYVDREFSSKIVEAHRKVILYDAAVRAEVGGGQNILLTDWQQFQHLYSAIIMPDGIESRYGQSISSSRGRSQSDICRRFNSSNGCPNNASICRYRHICSKCKQRGHSEPNCEAGKGKVAKKSST